MKKLLTAVLVIALTAVSASAQLLWKVTGPDMKSPSYIFGTHHVAPLSVIDSIAALKPALNEVEALYGEIDMADMTDDSKMMSIQKLLMAPADSTLSKVLSTPQIDSLVNVLNKYAGGMISAAHLEPLKPSAISAQLAMLQSSAAFPGFNPAEQLDLTMQTLARQAGKAVKGLETMDFQMNLLYGAPIAEQARALMSAVGSDSKSSHFAHLLASAYRTGNLDKIQSLFEDPEAGMTPEERERLVTSRNNAWIDFLIGIIPTTSVMVVVGVGHLPGTHGLIAQLRNAGYTVTPAN